MKGYSRKGKALFDLGRLNEALEHGIKDLAVICKAEDAYKAGLAVDSTNQGCTQGLENVKAGAAKRAVSYGRQAEPELRRHKVPSRCQAGCRN